MRAELSSFYVQKSQSDHGEQRSPGTTCKAILLSCCCLTSASVTHLHLYISVVSMNTHSNILATCSYSVLFYTLPGSFWSPPQPNMRFLGVESRSTWRKPTHSQQGHANSTNLQLGFKQETFCYTLHHHVTLLSSLLFCTKAGELHSDWFMLPTWMHWCPWSWPDLVFYTVRINFMSGA